MGMFDTVLVPCPKCGNKVGFQSKSGTCELIDFELDDAPAEVLAGANRHSPHKCDKCGAWFKLLVRVTAMPVVSNPPDDERSQELGFNVG